MGIEAKQAEVIEEFSLFQDWMEKYEYIIELGKELPLIDKKYEADENLIRGCQSRVWLHAEMDENQQVVFTANSDAIITKGLVALIIRVLSHESPEDIMHADLHFIEDIGLSTYLSPTRSNGLLAMVKQMKFYALAFQARQDAK